MRCRVEDLSQGREEQITNLEHLLKMLCSWNWDCISGESKAVVIVQVVVLSAIFVKGLYTKEYYHWNMASAIPFTNSCFAQFVFVDSAHWISDYWLYYVYFFPPRTLVPICTTSPIIKSISLNILYEEPLLVISINKKNNWYLSLL